jgi:hypothetical protein
LRFSVIFGIIRSERRQNLSLHRGKMTYTIQPIYMSGYINGQAFYYDLKSTSVGSSLQNVGDLVTAVDGSKTYLHRTYKRVWDLSWEYICYSGGPAYPLATVLKLQELYTSAAYPNTQLVFGMDSQDFLVLVEPNSWQSTLASRSVSLTNVPYYNVSFRLVEE